MTSKVTEIQATALQRKVSLCGKSTATVIYESIQRVPTNENSSHKFITMTKLKTNYIALHLHALP